MMRYYDDPSDYASFYEDNVETASIYDYDGWDYAEFISSRDAWDRVDEMREEYGYTEEEAYEAYVELYRDEFLRYMKDR